MAALLAPAPALAVTAVAAVAGSYVSGDLIGQSLYAYTQAVPWGTAASLAALAAALAWARRPRSTWPLALAGAGAALALLSKPEPALAALGACAVVLLAARARPAAWLAWTAAFGLAAGAALAWSAGAAGWQAVWRGYTGYDQLALGGLWGLPGAQTSPRRLLSLIAAWGAVLILLATGRGPRWRAAGRAAAALVAAAGLAAIVPDLFGLEGRQMLAVVRTGAWAGLRVHPEVALQWLAAAPWSGLTWALLWAGWRGRRAQLAAAWWGLWAFALLSNLRFTATGYASPAAVAPALAVLWRLWRASEESLPPVILSGSAAQRQVRHSTSEESPGGLPERRTRGDSSGLRPLRMTDGRRLRRMTDGRTPRRMTDGLRPLGMTGGRTPPGMRGGDGRGRPLTRGQRAAWMALAALALINLAARPLSTNVPGSGPTRAVPTVLGPVALITSQSDQVAAVRAQVTAMTPDAAPIFAAHWGAGWYLLTGRPNPAPCDVILEGLCTTAPEAGQVQAALAAAPPAAVILPAWLWRPEAATERLQRRAAALRAGLAPWWDTLAADYTDRTPAGVTDWAVLVRRGR